MSVYEYAPITVIVPCWRAKLTARRAFTSIAAQTLRPAEIIFVDDASDDGTIVLLRCLSQEYPEGRIKVIGLEENLGPGGARNIGWEAATQPWLAFLDADDVWHPQKIEIQYGWIMQQSGVYLCGHNTIVVSTDYNCQKISFKPKTWQINFWHMLIANRFYTRTVMLRRDLPFRFGGKSVTEDYLLWLQVLLSGYKCFRLDAPLAMSFRPDATPGGYSGQLWHHEKREMHAWLELRRQRAISTLTVCIALAWSLIKYLRRALRAMLK